MPSIMPHLCSVVLAAGEGARLRPLTLVRPKPLCPVDNVPLVDHALARAETVTDSVAVNVHHGREPIEAHLASLSKPVCVSVEEPEALGTAGALARLRPWIDGRDVVVLNSDTWCPGSLSEAVESWDRERVRLLVVGEDGFGPASRLAGALMPWREVSPLKPEPSGLYEVSWRHLAKSRQLDVYYWDGPCIDCGTPASYLAANMAASGGQTVIGPGAKVDGTAKRSVIWDGASVEAGEHLVDAVRADNRTTVLVR